MDKSKEQEKLSRLKEINDKHVKKRRLDNSKPKPFGAYCALTDKEKSIVLNKAKNLKRMGIKKPEVLRKVLLNLDDEDLLALLGFDPYKNLFNDK